MFELTKPYWSPVEAPQGDWIQIDAWAQAVFLANAQSEAKRMLFGAQPPVTVTGDVPIGEALEDGRLLLLKTPDFGDRCKVVVCASGAGSVYVQHETNGTGVAVECDGQAGVIAVAEYLVRDSGENETGGLVAVSAGSANSLRVWKDTSDLVVHSIAFAFLPANP